MIGIWTKDLLGLVSYWQIEWVPKRGKDINGVVRIQTPMDMQYLLESFSQLIGLSIDYSYTVKDDSELHYIIACMDGFITLKDMNEKVPRSSQLFSTNRRIIITRLRSADPDDEIEFSTYILHERLGIYKYITND